VRSIYLFCASTVTTIYTTIVENNCHHRQLVPNQCLDKDRASHFMLVFRKWIARVKYMQPYMITLHKVRTQNLFNSNTNAFTKLKFTVF
jgi:hypothetical protein